MKMGIFSINSSVSKQLINLLYEKYHTVEIITFNHEEEILDKINELDLKVLFYDLTMERYNFEILSSFRLLCPQTDIVVGTYAKMLPSSYFDIKTMGFLCYPCGEEEIKKVLDRIEEKSTSLFAYKKNKTTFFERISNIRYFKSDGREIVIKCFDDKDKIFYANLNDVQLILDKKGGDFLRVHQSYIVNTNSILKIKKDSVVLDNNEKVPISRSYGKAINKKAF